MTTPRKHRHAEMIKRWLDDDSLEVEIRNSYGWSIDVFLAWDKNEEYRFKPKMIRCGDMEFPEPMRVAPEEGSICWIACIPFNTQEVNWSNHTTKLEWLRTGILHTTQAAAEAHARALIALTESKS